MDFEYSSMPASLVACVDFFLKTLDEEQQRIACRD
jgi:hypothetical protein